MRILLVEDDAMLGKAVSTGLSQLGNAVDWVHDGRSAIEAAHANEYHAMVLDLGLPRADGMEVLSRLRRNGWSVPVIIITARDSVQDRVGGLDGGADDFIVKPFDMGELGARLRAVVRRGAGRTQALLEHGPLALDSAGRVVTLDGQPVQLTPREFTLLQQLLEHRGQVLSRAQLEENMYSWAQEIESNAIEVHVHHLRRKLGKDLIRTVHGLGYTIGTRHETA
ncbi:MAG: response regulator [Steroidobacteraceae bacterium]